MWFVILTLNDNKELTQIIKLLQQKKPKKLPQKQKENYLSGQNMCHS